MKSVAHIGRIRGAVVARTESKGSSLDTTFVLFFLSMEFGRIATGWSFDLILMGITMLAVGALPYYLLSEDRPEFGVWLAGRAWITAFAIAIGVLFNQAVGGILPEMLRFAPMSLLIVSAMLSCQVQFYRALKFRPSR